MPTKLFLIRHGTTDWSKEKRYCGFTNIGLNAEGRKQAKRLCLRLDQEDIQRIYSSDLRRTKEFSRIVFPGRALRCMPELREIDFGIFEGMNYKEIMKKYPQIYRRWLIQPLKFTIPQGERFSDFKKRVKRALKDLLGLNKNKTLAIVTHAGPIKIILGSILKKNEAWGVNVDLASLNIIEFSGRRAKIKLLNNK